MRVCIFNQTHAFCLEYIIMCYYIFPKFHQYKRMPSHDIQQIRDYKAQKATLG